jgi:hypothetical protein
MKNINSLKTILKLSGYNPTFDKTLLFPTEIKEFVNEHGLEYAALFNEDVVIKIKITEATNYFLFYNVFEDSYSFAGFSSGNDWQEVESIFSKFCEK